MTRYLTPRGRFVGYAIMALIGWRWSLNNPPYGPVKRGWTLTKQAAFRRVNANKEARS
jgi:hypothetical protein